MKKVLISLCFLVLCSVSFAGPKEDLVGYYKIDVESVKKKLEEQIASSPEEKRAMMRAQLEAMVKSFSGIVLQFTETENNTWARGKPKQTRTYTVEKVEGDLLTVQYEKSKNDFIVKKDSIEVVTEGGGMKFLKITEKEAKEIIAKAEAEVEKKEAPPINEELPAEGGMK